MRKKIVLITGANGEIGHELIKLLYGKGVDNIVTLDLQPINNNIKSMIIHEISGDILDTELLGQVSLEYEIQEIYHLAALLSTQSELSPLRAHEVNVTGTLNMLSLAIRQTKINNKIIKFFFPSSIAVYNTKSNDKNKIKEQEYCNPKTMYGCNKLYCEKLGIYYSNNYQKLSDNFRSGLVDFRAIRFPGLISAFTTPTGGTSDYLPEMLHAAMQKKKYICFVHKNTKMPFMLMPDAISAIYTLMNTSKNRLSSHVYNITSFNPSPDEFYCLLKKYLPNTRITYCINEQKQEMVDSWPSNIDDSLARNDWGWSPEYNLEKSFKQYLIPSVKKYYNIKD